MSARALRPPHVAAAAVLIGGIVVTALPQHALSVFQIVVVTVAVTTGIHALAVHVPATGWLSPFRWMSPFHARGRSGHDGPGDLDAIRAKLAGRRVPVADGPPLPVETLRLLRPLIRRALHLEPAEARSVHALPWMAADPRDPVRRGDYRPDRLIEARRRVSALTWSVLTAEDPDGPAWLRSRRPDQDQVAEAVHRVLDDLERVAAGLEPEPHLPSSPDPRSP